MKKKHNSYIYFEQRWKDIFKLECPPDISASLLCRIYNENKPTFGGEIDLEMNTYEILPHETTRKVDLSLNYQISKGSAGPRILGYTIGIIVILCLPKHDP